HATTAAHGSMNAFRIPCGVVGVLTNVFPGGVVAPLVDITVHVEQSPRGREFFSHGMGPAACVVAIPSMAPQTGFIVTMRPSGRRSCAAEEFPLRFGRESVAGCWSIPIDSGVKRCHKIRLAGDNVT